MDQVITFDKSLLQRLEEYSQVFSSDHTVPASSIQKEWGFYLELALDPTGWQAVWKIQRNTCETLDIPFPSVVLVYVLGIDHENLNALVKILAVQDDIHLPDKMQVPLMHLWPTKHQDKSVALNLDSTANALDMLRFFYNYLLMPWDMDESDSEDWKNNHLETRLKLYYDIKNGVIPRMSGDYIHSLISEAKRLHSKQSALEAEISDLSEYENPNVDDNKHVQQLMDIDIRLMQINCEMNVLENPILRKAMIKRHAEMSSPCKKASDQQSVWVICDSAKVDDYIAFLQEIKLQFPQQILNYQPCLYSTLDMARANDIFILSQATHLLKNTGALAHGGILRGHNRDNTHITSTLEDVIIDIRQGDVLIENLTIDATSAQCAILVRSGHLTLKNCKLLGDGKSSTHQGILVLGEGKLNLVNCDLGGFNTAIVGNSGSFVNLSDSVIHDVHFGLKIYDNCTLSAVETVIRDCKDYGICVETENSEGGQEPRIGNFETLRIIPNLRIEHMRGENNAKGDAVVNQMVKLDPIQDLFGNPDLDPTICEDQGDEGEVEDDDEEMEADELNKTVIENTA